MSGPTPPGQRTLLASAASSPCRPADAASARAASSSRRCAHKLATRNSGRPHCRSPVSSPGPRCRKSSSAMRNPSPVATTASRRRLASSEHSGPVSSTQNERRRPRPTRPRNWWSCARPKRSAFSITITEALGTSTPTSITVVAHSTPTSPAANAAITDSRSPAGVRPWTASTLTPASAWRTARTCVATARAETFSDSSMSGNTQYACPPAATSLRRNSANRPRAASSRSTVRTGMRPGGISSITETSRAPYSESASERGIGVAQRQAMLAKGEGPHVLVMTATPIPRSLALSLYGDLDVSVIDEMPPGRIPVRTVLRDDAARGRLAEFLRKEVAAGGQAYWVFPLIEESEKVSARAVATHVRAVRQALAGVRVEAVHGRTPAGERESVMAAFAAGEVGVLCATTVIEVGVDVPNASVMVIENAERFGLAQLHQLRGRVGRGRRRSFCVLLTGPECSDEARRRLEAVVATGDGFRIAEEDFRQRGPGELTGLRQWGRPEFLVASLWAHRRELEAARALAAAAGRQGELAALAKRVRCPGGVGPDIQAG